MYTVVETDPFVQWMRSLRDMSARIRLRRRLDRVTRGVLGDVRPVGEGVWEMREFFGPGWRMYYVPCDGVLLMMLGGGDKSTQQEDIRRAIALAKELQQEQRLQDEQNQQDKNQDPPV